MTNYTIPAYDQYFDNNYFIQQLSEDLVKALKACSDPSSSLFIGSPHLNQLSFTIRNIVYAALNERQTSFINSSRQVSDSFAACLESSVDENDLLRSSLSELLMQEVVTAHFRQALDQGIAQVTKAYTDRIKSLEVVLVDVLKIYGATALVSGDPEVRNQAETLLKANNIDIDKLLKDHNQ